LVLLAVVMVVDSAATTPIANTTTLVTTGGQRHHSPGAPGPSIRAVVPREEALTMLEIVVVPMVIAIEQEVVVPEVGAMLEIAAEEVVNAEYEDEVSASNITANADELLPPLPAFAAFDCYCTQPSRNFQNRS
jgi:hypothetical protein